MHTDTGPDTPPDTASLQSAQTVTVETGESLASPTAVTGAETGAVKAKRQSTPAQLASLEKARHARARAKAERDAAKKSARNLVVENELSSSDSEFETVIKMVRRRKAKTSQAPPSDEDSQPKAKQAPPSDDDSQPKAKQAAPSDHKPQYFFV